MSPETNTVPASTVFAKKKRREEEEEEEEEAGGRRKRRGRRRHTHTITHTYTHLHWPALRLIIIHSLTKKWIKRERGKEEE